METRCFLRTLGPPALLGPTGEPVRFRVKKHLALLAYLAVEPTAAHRRDALADFLWPQASASEGRHSLATALSVLRARLGRAAFETTRDTVRLTGLGLELDLTRLASGDVLGDEVRRPLEVGAFLDGLEIPDADEFLRWKERHQARLLPSIVEAMILLIDRCRRTADSRQMERIADRMLVLDPLSEDALRAKMEARALAGDRVTALRAFEDFRTQLREELDAAPSMKLERLAARLRRRGWERTDGPPVAPVPPVVTEQWRGRPFIGRANEHRRLYEAWERMQKGQPGHVLVRGDSGIGKTTILERVATAAVLEGAASSRVQCYELEREIPYAAVTGLVLGLLDKPGASATPPDSLAELARTVPDVRQRFPSIPPAIESHGETARVRLTEALHDLVSAIAEEHPVILVVDDLHLADDASLAVLHLLIRRASGQPLMVMLAVRQGELGRSPQALRLLESAEVLGFVEVELVALPDSEASEFLDSLIGPDEHRPGAAARRALLSAGAGYPMVLELMLQDWQLNGEQSLALSLGAMTAELHSAEGANAGPYDAVFDRILQTIDPTTRAVLNLGAVLGHRLNALPMYGIVEMGLGQAMHGLSELAKLRVLRDGGQRMEFVNELLRAYAYRAVPSPVRRQLHSEVADWLLQGKKGGEQAGGLELAWHCIRAGRQPEAIPHLFNGAREALESGAPHESELALSSALPSLPPQSAPEARLLLIEAIQEQGRYDETLPMLQPLGELGGACNSTAFRERILALQTAARVNAWSMSASELSGAARAMISVVRNGREPRTQLRAAQVAALALNELRDPSIGRELVAAAELIQPDEYTLHERLALSIVRAQAELLGGTEATDNDAVFSRLAQTPALGAVSSLSVRLMMISGAVLAGMGEYERAVEYHQRAYKMAIRLGRDATAASSASNLAVCYLRIGNLPQQLEWADTCLRISGSRASHLNGRMHAIYCRALALSITGSAKAAKELMREGDALIGPSAPAWILQLWQLFKADVLATAGAHAESIGAARQAIDYFNPGPAGQHFIGTYCRWFARAAQNIAERGAATAYIEATAKHLSRFDALDQSEILLAATLTGDRNLEARGTAEELQRKLATLPQGIANHFERVGMLRRQVAGSSEPSKTRAAQYNPKQA
jgi:DNA-binding SARP family transcriptional activator/tetratricopeptide (TPR) repeat protein